MTDDDCYSDEKIIGEIADATTTVAKMAATIWGYHGTYDHNSKFEKLTIGQMHKNIHAKAKATGLKKQCPVREFIHFVEDEINNFEVPTFEMPGFEMAPTAFNPFYGMPAAPQMSFPNLF